MMVLFVANSCEIINYNADIQKYTAQINQNPNDAEAYYRRGNAYANLGKYKLAIADYDKAIELNPDFVWAYNTRGIAYYELEKY